MIKTPISQTSPPSPFYYIVRMKTTIVSIAMFAGIALADTCYMQLQQQFNGGIGGSASGVQGAIKRGDCPKDVDTPNTDDCEVLAEFTPGPGPSDVDAGLEHVSSDWLPCSVFCCM